MIVERPCPRCGTTIYEVSPRRPGRPPHWCSARCRRAASEERRAAANGAIVTQRVVVPMSLDDHVAAVLESPVACGRVLRAVRERFEAGLMGDAKWDSVKFEVERFRPAPRPQLRWGDR